MFSKIKNHKAVGPSDKHIKEDSLKSSQLDTILENYVAQVNRLERDVARLKEELAYQKKLHGELSDSLDEFITIQKASEIITQHLEYEKIVASLLKLCQRVLDFSRGDIYLLTEDQWQAVGQEDDSEFALIIQSMNEEGIIEWIWNHRHPIVIPVSDLMVSDRLQHDSGNLVVSPLMVNNTGLGLFILHTLKEQANFSSRDLELLHILAQQAATAIQYTRLYKNLEKAHIELKNSQTQLLQAIRLATVGELAGGIAHEINNPLQIILGKIQMASLEDQVEDTLKVVEMQAMRIATIVRGLLTLARKSTTNAKEFIEINAIINSALNLVRGQIEKRRIKIELETAPNLPVFLGNSTYLQQVLLNFILNAKNRMPDGGKLKISTRFADEKWIVIEFKDTGIPLSPEEVHHVLHLFSISSPSSKTSPTLGLTVSVQMIRDIGGEVDIKVQPDKGNEIIIKVPKTTPKEFVNGSSVPSIPGS